mmetsp:Transcript_122635/g.291643  ORF Transcript_122635/g.291643 Transcript_122635/m.291643 type:complete len:228 (-) Transcript_122635:892-1575(-)
MHRADRPGLLLDASDGWVYRDRLLRGSAVVLRGSKEFPSAPLAAAPAWLAHLPGTAQYRETSTPLCSGRFGLPRLRELAQAAVRFLDGHRHCHHGGLRGLDTSGTWPDGGVGESGIEAGDPGRVRLHLRCHGERYEGGGRKPPDGAPPHADLRGIGGGEVPTVAVCGHRHGFSRRAEPLSFGRLLRRSPEPNHHPERGCRTGWWHAAVQKEPEPRANPQPGLERCWL